MVTDCKSIPKIPNNLTLYIFMEFLFPSSEETVLFLPKLSMLPTDSQLMTFPYASLRK